MRQSAPARAGLHALNVLTILALLFPIIAAVIASLQSQVVLLGSPNAVLPPEITWDNYRIMLAGRQNTAGTIYAGIAYLPDVIDQFGRAVLNSLVIACSVTALTMVCGALSAYTVSRLRLRWLTWLTGVNVVARFVPVVALMIPLYVTFRSVGLVNSLTGVVIAETGFLLPYGVFILAPYFGAIPAEIEEASRIDGCTRFGSFWRIVLPLSGPILVSFAAIVFIIAWNDLLIPLILNSKPEFMTVPVILVSLIGDNNVFFGLLTACSLLALSPTLILVAVLQRYVVQGLTAGAVKG